MIISEEQHEEIYRKRLGRKLAAIRRNAEISIFELARRIDVNASTLGACERGLLWPSARVLFLIARTVQLPVEHLLP